MKARNFIYIGRAFVALLYMNTNSYASSTLSDGPLKNLAALVSGEVVSDSASALAHDDKGMHTNVGLGLLSETDNLDFIGGGSYSEGSTGPSLGQIGNVFQSTAIESQANESSKSNISNASLSLNPAILSSAPVTADAFSFSPINSSLSSGSSSVVGGSSSGFALNNNLSTSPVNNEPFDMTQFLPKRGILGIGAGSESTFAKYNDPTVIEKGEKAALARNDKHFAKEPPSSSLPNLNFPNLFANKKTNADQNGCVFKRGIVDVTQSSKACLEMLALRQQSQQQFAMNQNYGGGTYSSAPIQSPAQSPPVSEPTPPAVQSTTPATSSSSTSQSPSTPSVQHAGDFAPATQGSTPGLAPVVVPGASPPAAKIQGTEDSKPTEVAEIDIEIIESIEKNQEGNELSKEKDKVCKLNTMQANKIDLNTLVKNFKSKSLKCQSDLLVILFRGIQEFCSKNMVGLPPLFYRDLFYQNKLVINVDNKQSNKIGGLVLEDQKTNRLNELQKRLSEFSKKQPSLPSSGIDDMCKYSIEISRAFIGAKLNSVMELSTIASMIAEQSSLFPANTTDEIASKNPTTIPVHNTPVGLTNKDAASSQTSGDF